MSTIQDLLNERARRKEAMTNGIIKSFQPEIEKSNETDFYDEVEKNKEFLKKKKEAKSKNKAYDKKVKKVMDEFKNGELTTSNGELVTERKQALAIALSEAKDLKKSEYDDLDLKKAIEHEDFWDELSKAHQDGDVHPNGKWVWVSSANGGRGDWRTQGGRTHNKTNDNKFNNTFKDARTDVLNKIIDGSIQSSDREKQLAKKILDDRKKANHVDVSKLTANEKQMIDKVVDRGYKTLNSKYNDKDKMSLEKTPKGNWHCYYDGKDTGNTISGDLITDAVAKKMGWIKTGNQVSKKDINNKIPNSVDDAIKNVKLDDETIKKIKKEAKESINLKYASEDIYKNDTDISLWTDRLELAIEKKDKKMINELSLNVLKSKLYSNEFKKELSKLKKEKSDFIKNSKYDFTDSQVEEYLKKYNTEKDPRAIVHNSWHTLMGHIGSTSATIKVGNGKEKPMKESSYPSWRPIGILNYKVRGWDGDKIEIKKPVQSWEEIEKNLDDTENFSLYLYKHPKQ